MKINGTITNGQLRHITIQMKAPEPVCAEVILQTIDGVGNDAEITVLMNVVGYAIVSVPSKEPDGKPSQKLILTLEVGAQ